MTPVTDPQLIAKLEASSGSSSKVVTDPRMIGQLEFGVDFDQPVDAVRKSLGAIPDQQRERALQLWADHYVSKERASGGTGMAADNTVRTLARGTFVGPFLDEISAAGNSVAYDISNGNVGAPYDESLAYQRARDRAVDKDYPVASVAGRLAGGLAGGVGAIRQGGGLAATAVGGPLAVMAPAATTASRIGQGTAVGTKFGAVAGAGEAEGGVGNRLEGALIGAGTGAVLGTALGVGGETIRGVRQAYAGRGAAGAYGQVAESLPQSPGRGQPNYANPVDAFADQVATAHGTNNAAMQRQTLDLLGEEMQRANGNVQAARQATIQRMVTEQDLTPTTAADRIRRLEQLHQDSPLNLSDYPSVAANDQANRLRRPANMTDDQFAAYMDDVANASRETGLQGKVDYLSNNGTAPSAMATREAVTDQFNRMPNQMRDTLEGISPRVNGQPAGIVDTGAMVENATLLGSQAYAATYRAPVNTQIMLQTLPRLLAANETRALGRSGEARDAIEKAVNQFYLTPAPGQRIAMGTLRQLQDARTVVRGQMDGYARAGRNDLAGVVRPFYQQMTRLMESMSPEWAIANRQWSDMNFLRMGQELGDSFAKRAGPQFREQMQEFDQLAPQAQDIVRVHFLQQMFDKIDNAGDAQAVAKFFTTDHTRSAIARLFGRAEAMAFTRAVRNIKVAEGGKAALGNSATHRRGIAQEQAEQNMGVVSAFESASESGVKKYLMDTARRVLMEGINRPMSEILTTPMSDTARIAQHIQGMRTQQQRMQTLQQPSDLRLPIASASSVSGQMLAPKPRQNALSR
jgi:hypothetical protein